MEQYGIKQEIKNTCKIKPDTVKAFRIIGKPQNMEMQKRGKHG
jgi:hypothetical protein